MTPGIEPFESKKFIKVLLMVSGLWLASGMAIHANEPEQMFAFIQIFLFTFLDLVFLLLLFWKLFFTRSGSKVQIMIFGFFKLVCLAFLAITLKRLRNASVSAVLMGVGFIWIGPLISGVCLKLFSKKMN